MQKMITWEPSVYLPGIGIIKLDETQLQDFIAVGRGEKPKTALAQSFFARPSIPA